VVEDIGVVVSLFEFTGVIIACGFVFEQIVVGEIVLDDSIFVVGYGLVVKPCCSLYLRFRILFFRPLLIHNGCRTIVVSGILIIGVASDAVEIIVVGAAVVVVTAFEML